MVTENTEKIQACIDELIAKYGCERVMYLLHAVSDVTRVSHIKMIKAYILFIVSNYYDLTINEVVHGTNRECTGAKKVAMYLLKEEGLSLREIGELFNGLGKSRVHAHIKDISSWVETGLYKDIQEQVSVVTGQLQKFKSHLQNTFFYDRN